MLPGPIRIMKAPGCKRPVKFLTISSGNTFRAVYWTDGKREAPMLRDNPLLRKAPEEDVLFWSHECEEIGSIGDRYQYNNEYNPEWEDLEFAQEPSESDYLRAIDEGMGFTLNKILYLRMRLWWIGNDGVRKKKVSGLPEIHLANLWKLGGLLSEDNPDMRLLKAEVFRELGDFKEARRLLEFSFPEDHASAARQILELANAGDAKVQRLRAG
jgi:hypothetical protein